MMAALGAADLANSPHQPDAKRALSDAELTTLKLLWGRGELTPSELHEQLAEAGATWAYPTVQTLLHRMLEKGYVERERQGRHQVYRAVLDRSEVVAAELARVADKFCDGARSVLLQGLLDGENLTAAEVEELRGLLEAHRGKPKARRRR